MAPAPTRPRDRVHRPRVQPSRRRLARRLRPALALAVALAACAPSPAPAAPEDFRARLLEGRWEDLRTFDADAFVAQMKAYAAGEDPALPRDDGRFESYFRALVRLRPAPASLAPLLGPRGDGGELIALIKRDWVAHGIVISYLIRIGEGDDARAGLYDAVAEAGVHFSFDPAYGDSHTQTSIEVVDFFADPEIPPCDESRAALGRHLDALLAKWRGRVTQKGTSTMAGVLLRHLGRPAALRLLAEWDGMEESERIDLLRRLGREEAPGPAVLSGIASRVVDPSPEVRAAALEALERHGAPVEGLDASVREADLRAALPRVEAWIAELRRDGDS